MEDLVQPTYLEVGGDTIYPNSCLATHFMRRTLRHEVGKPIRAKALTD